MLTNEINHEYKKPLYIENDPNKFKQNMIDFIKTNFAELLTAEELELLESGQQGLETLSQRFLSKSKFKI